MIKLTITEKAFVAMTRRLPYSQLEHFVLANNKVFALAFGIWLKFDDQAHIDYSVFAKEQRDYFNNLGGALQI